MAAIWSGLADGSVHTLGSDHAPWSLRDKIDDTLDVTTARQGVADLETIMPMLFSAGVRTGRISLTRFVELTSANPARLFGLYPRKGTIAVGSDADLVILDPELSRTIDGRSMQSNADYSVYDGREIHGWPRFTVSRGDVVLADGEIVAEPGRGQLLRRDPRPGCSPAPARQSRVGSAVPLRPGNPASARHPGVGPAVPLGPAALLRPTVPPRPAVPGRSAQARPSGPACSPAGSCAACTGPTSRPSWPPGASGRRSAAPARPISGQAGTVDVMIC